MLRALSKVIQVMVQVIIDAPHIHLCIEVHEHITKPHHLHQGLGEGSREDN